MTRHHYILPDEYGIKAIELADAEHRPLSEWTAVHIMNAIDAGTPAVRVRKREALPKLLGTLLVSAEAGETIFGWPHFTADKSDVRFKGICLTAGADLEAGKSVVVDPADGKVYVEETQTSVRKAVKK